MKNRIGILGILIFLSTSTLLAKEFRGSDVTPKNIQKKYYIWDKKTEEPNPKSKNNEDIWYNEYSQPMEGYIILLSKERLTGKIIVHHRWNKASVKKLKKTTYDKDGNKVVNYYPDPKGIDIIQDIQLITAEGNKTIATTEILNYGPYFKMADWDDVKGQKSEVDKFQPGSYETLDGQLKQGFITLRTYMYLKRKFDLRYFHLAFYAENENTHAELLYADDLKSATLNSTLYINYRNRYLLDRDLMISSLETEPQKLSYDPLQDGSIVTSEGEEIKGRITKKNARFVNTSAEAKIPTSKSILFIDEQKNIQYLSPNSKSLMYFTVEGVDFYSVEGSFMSRDALKLDQGKFVYKDGTEKNGELTYRNNYFLFNDGSGKLNSVTIKNADNLDYALIGEGDAVRKVIFTVDGTKKYFMEVKSPFGKYSYFKNPNPTHVRSGASLFTSVAAGVASDMIEDKVREAGGETEGDVVDDDIEIYFEEWVVIINKTGEKFTLYKKNLEDQKRALIGSCQRMSVDNRNLIKNIAKMSEIDLLVNTLNQCADPD
ncbi:MAG: hypothetical protein KDD41_06820 [Flavobacteriales bacterium]|nr:hypothetical protein [Flavobacteriales bacterium]